MRALCLISGGCKWEVIREEWIEKAKDRPYSLLVRFCQCKYCNDTRATLTSPKDTESFFCIPDKFCTVPMGETK